MIERVQAGLVAAIAATQPPGTSVLWAPSEFPRAAATPLVIACRLLAGPDAAPLGGDSVSPARLPTVVTVRVVAPAVGESVLLRASGRRLERTFASADATAERDAWLAELTENSLLRATITASGADAITIEADELGDLYDVAIHESAPGLASLVIDEDAVALVQVVDARCYVEIQAYSTSRYPRTGAAAALNRFRGRMRLPMVAEVLEGFGLGVVGSPGAVVSLDALAGPTWASRAAMSVYVASISIAAQVVESIDRVRATIEVRPSSADDAIALVADTGDPA